MKSTTDKLNRRTRPRSSRSLTAHHIRIIAMYADGMMGTEIARALDNTHYTIQSHTHDILRLMNAKNTKHAIAIAFIKNLIK